MKQRKYDKKMQASDGGGRPSSPLAGFVRWLTEATAEEAAQVDMQLAMTLCGMWEDAERAMGRAVALTTISELAARGGMCRRRAAEGLARLEGLGLVGCKEVRHARAIWPLAKIVQSEGEKAAKMGERKEDKERRKGSSPAPPTIKEEKEKEEKSVRKEEKEKTPTQEFASLDERREAFRREVAQYAEQYGKDTAAEFYAHWAEVTQDGSKMRWEMERTWSTAGRMAKWRRYGAVFEKRPRRGEGTNVNTPEQEAEKERRAQERRAAERERAWTRLQAAPPDVVREATRAGVTLLDTDQMAEGLRGSTHAGVVDWIERRDKLRAEYVREYGEYKP